MMSKSYIHDKLKVPLNCSVFQRDMAGATMSLGRGSKIQRGRAYTMQLLPRQKNMIPSDNFPNQLKVPLNCNIFQEGIQMANKCLSLGLGSNIQKGRCCIFRCYCNCDMFLGGKGRPKCIETSTKRRSGWSPRIL